MVSCSVAAYNTEAQGVQESLSKVRDLQATVPLRGAASIGHPGDVRPFPCLWAGPSLTESASKHTVAWRSLTHKCALRWGQRERKALPGDLKLKGTTRTELPEC